MKLNKKLLGAILSLGALSIVSTNTFAFPGLDSIVNSVASGVASATKDGSSGSIAETAKNAAQ